VTAPPDDPDSRATDEDEFAVPAFLGRWGLTEEDRAALVQQLAEAGAGEDEIAEAKRTGTLGVLALDVALRPPGEPVPFAAAAADAGLSLEEASRLWRALGFAVPSDGSLRLTSAEASMLRVLVELGREVVGEDRIVGFARVLGWATGVLGEALVDAFRVQVEVPRLGSGATYGEIVSYYTELAKASFPSFVNGLGVLTRAHMLRISRSAWQPDEHRSAVTREQTIGFADLVGYTGHSHSLSTTDLASAVGQFETRVTDLVSQFGGRLVKFIGDEAMFVVADAATGCELAVALSESFESDAGLPPVRVGLAAGPAVALHGDYYGDVVNLAARLVSSAAPSEIIVSESLRQAAGDRFDFEPLSEMALKGFDVPVNAFRLVRRQPSPPG
jgi:class 3 adenylate cyclase